MREAEVHDIKRDNRPQVIFLVGPSCSGKTTTAHQISKRHSIPAFSADKVYIEIYNLFEMTCPLEDIFNPEKWHDPNNFGMNNWGKFASMDEIKRHFYSQMLGSAASDVLVEGSSLAHLSERELVKDILQSRKNHVVLFELSFGEWSNMHYKRRKNENVFLWGREYRKILDAYEYGGEDTILRIKEIGDAVSRVCDLLKMVGSPCAYEAGE